MINFASTIQILLRNEGAHTCVMVSVLIRYRGNIRWYLFLLQKTTDEFVCAVCTLGTKDDWRVTSTPIAEMSSRPSSPHFLYRMVTKISRKACNSATLCGGDLYWRTTNEGENNRKIEMLLSFDLHHEKIQFTRLPDIASPTTRSRLNPRLVVDHYLLEFKGYPCIAYVESKMLTCCMSLFCDSCCRCKVVLYLLKDKVKQEWTKGETFDSFRIKQDDEVSVPDSFRCYTKTVYKITPPMRLLTFSDQVLMYWYDGACLALYNLHTKHLNVVKGSRYYRKINCPYMDYQLHAQPENLRTLKTFIPEGETIEYNCHDDFSPSVATKKPARWVISGRDSPKYYVFL